MVLCFFFLVVLLIFLLAFVSIDSLTVLSASLSLSLSSDPSYPFPNGLRIKRRKLAWIRRVTHHDSLSKTILQGTLEGGRRRGRQRKCWMDNINERTSLPMPELHTRASCRKDWNRVSAESSLMSSLRTSRSRDCAELTLSTQLTNGYLTIVS